MLSNYVDSVDFTFYFIVAISLALLLLVTFLMVFFVVKYNRKKHPKAVNIHGNIALEIAWTVIPVILVMGMFYFGWYGYQTLENVPADAMVVKVTGQMWKWTFTYDNGLATDTLYVPQNKAVRLNLNSNDVNHAFFIPAFRIKRDVIPNRNNFLWFRSEKIGSFDIACAEYCGLQHSYMYTKVVVMPQGAYSAWMDAQKAKLNAATVAPGK